MFDQVREKYSLTLYDLSRCADDQLTTLVRVVIGPDKPIDQARLRTHLTEYLTAKK